MRGQARAAGLPGLTRRVCAPGGRSSPCARTGDAGTTARFHFCPVCGDTVYCLMEAGPDAVAIPAGAFADPHFPVPTVSVYGVRRDAWVRLPDGIQAPD